MIRLTSGKDFAAALLVLAVSVVYLLWSYSYPPSLGTIPALAAWLAIALSIIDLAAQTRTRTGDLVRRAIGQSAEEDGEQEQAPAATSELAAVAWPLGYVVLLMVFGFLPVTPVYVFLYMWLHGKLPGVSSLIAAIAVTLIIWVTFVVLFRYPLFPGLAFGGLI